MARPIYELLMKGQSVLISGQKGSYRVSQSLKKNVFKGYIEGTSTPSALCPQPFFLLTPL